VIIVSPPTVRLPLNTSVRECAALKQQLLVLVDSADAVSIDVSDVELIDTAALQLLFAFSRERIANGLGTIWHGDGPAFRSAASAMGLQLGDSPGASTNRACKHDT
jgi:phospholipid transport system transporter-binding protein